MLQRTEIILVNSYQRKRMNRFESGWGIPDKVTGTDHRWCVPGPGSGYWYISIAHFFFSGKAFLGPLLQLGTVRTINRFPCLLAPQGVGQACSLYELRARVCPGLEANLGVLPTSGGFECRGHASTLLLLQASQKWQLDFWSLWILII